MSIEKAYSTSYLMAIVFSVTIYEIVATSCTTVTLTFRIGHGQMQIYQSKSTYSSSYFMATVKSVTSFAIFKMFVQQ